MKRRLWMLLIAVLLLTGCSSLRKSVYTAVTVVLEAGEHFTAEQETIAVEPGESVLFQIKTDPNYMVTGTDYGGAYTLTASGDTFRLELENVRYPVRIRLDISHAARTIRYLANGGTGLTDAGGDVTEHYDVRVHIRPNVSIGTDIFTRDGYTLTGWNTDPDGNGQRVGLGSRMSVADSAVLYAQWAAWTDPAFFTYEIRDGNAVLTGCTATDREIVVPESLDGAAVTAIGAYAFETCPAETVILPKSLKRIEENAFAGAALRELHFFDNIEYITDACFPDCGNFSTLYISAIEDPYGYAFRRESLLADKFDLLIETMGQERILFYGGCSMWYNLVAPEALAALGDRYTLVNMGLNGVSSSLFQMELLRNFVTEKDILFHTPEISSTQQLLTTTNLSKNDDKLWCAMEYNYDLVSLLDIRAFDGGVLESLRLYLNKKKPGGRYTDVYHDSKGFVFLDEIGCVPFVRTEQADSLADKVELDPAYLADMSRLEQEYTGFTEKGIPVYVSYAAIDIDRVPQNQRSNVDLMGELFTERFNGMDGVTVVGSIRDFLFRDDDFYDTVYHLLTEPARECTAVWMQDLTAALKADGRWSE